MNHCASCRHWLKRPAVNFGDCSMAERRESELRMPSLLSVIVYEYEGQDCPAFEQLTKRAKSEVPVDSDDRVNGRKKRIRKGTEGMSAPGVPVEVEDGGD